MRHIMQEGAYLYALLKMEKKPALVITIFLIIVISAVITWTIIIEFYDFGLFLLVFNFVLIGCAIYLYRQ
jgi:hypothetical protein